MLVVSFSLQSFFQHAACATACAAHTRRRQNYLPHRHSAAPAARSLLLAARSAPCLQHFSARQISPLAAGGSGRAEARPRSQGRGPRTPSLSNACCLRHPWGSNMSPSHAWCDVFVALPCFAAVGKPEADKELQRAEAHDNPSPPRDSVPEPVNWTTSYTHYRL